MAKTREIRKRIGSVRNIHKITRTMEKVAQSKSMKLTGRYEAAAAFRGRVARLIPEALGAALGSQDAALQLARHPLGAPRPAEQRVLLFCVTSSRGLCGGYNARVIQAVRARMEELARAGKEPVLAVMGKKGLAYFRFHEQPVAMPFPDVDENLPYVRVDELVQGIIERYLARQLDAVEIISTRARTRALQEVRGARLLPISVAAAAAAGEGAAASPTQGPTPGPDGNPLYLVEPDRDRVLSTLLPLQVKADLFCGVLEAMLCEQGQRSLAMRSASDNAESMTRALTRTYNRVRQAQITNEMIEIISGSEGGRI